MTETETAADVAELATFYRNLLAGTPGIARWQAAYAARDQFGVGRYSLRQMVETFNAVKDGSAPRAIALPESWYIAEDGEREPTIWRPREGRTQHEALMRRCENPVVFDLLAAALPTVED